MLIEREELPYRWFQFFVWESQIRCLRVRIMVFLCVEELKGLQEVRLEPGVTVRRVWRTRCFAMELRSFDLIMGQELTSDHCEGILALYEALSMHYCTLSLLCV